MGRMAEAFEEFQEKLRAERTERERIEMIAGKAVADEIQSIREATKQAEEHAERIKNDLEKAKHEESQNREQVEKARELEAQRAKAEEFEKKAREMEEKRAEELRNQAREAKEKGEAFDAEKSRLEYDRHVRETQEQARLEREKYENISKEDPEVAKNSGRILDDERDRQAHRDRLEKDSAEADKRAQELRDAEPEKINGAIEHLPPETQDAIRDEINHTNSYNDSMDGSRIDNDPGVFLDDKGRKETFDFLTGDTGVNANQDLIGMFVDSMGAKAAAALALALEGHAQALAELGKSIERKMQERIEMSLKEREQERIREQNREQNKNQDKNRPDNERIPPPRPAIEDGNKDKEGNRNRMTV